ncbi:MAG: hypothetical protein PHE89_07510 [Alphaproteobacteria bacterium]|nr:hypothetical protein [Alphaproteobacteria bacterium]
MKKSTALIALSAMLLGACSLLDTASSGKTDVSTLAKLKSCSFEEATTLVKNGTALSKGITETAEDISNSCLKKLALQSAGLENVATDEATSALQSLMDASSSLLD